MPLRPPRILVLRDKQMNQVSKRVVSEVSHKLDLVAVVAKHCIHKQIELKSEMGALLQANSPKIIKGSNIPDDIMNCLILTELKSIKARNYGWVCEGFPRNVIQLNKFKNERVEPDLVTSKYLLIDRSWLYRRTNTPRTTMS